MLTWNYNRQVIEKGKMARLEGASNGQALLAHPGREC